MRITLAAAALACGVAASFGAMAQSRSEPAPRGGNPAEDAVRPSVPPAISTLTPTRGISGPRLEPGAVICNSAQSLQNRAEINQRIADGAADAGNAMSGCRLINQERGVEVISRQGLGRLQVRLKPSGEVGWTDAFIR